MSDCFLLCFGAQQRERATISSGARGQLYCTDKVVVAFSLLSKFNEYMLRIQFFLLTIKIDKQSDVYPALQKGIFQRSRGHDF